MTPKEQLKERIKVLEDWRGPMVAKLSDIIQETNPDLILDWKWDTAVWSKNGLVCAIGAFKDNVGINFFKGASLEDPYHLFNAGLEAKASRSVRFFEGDPVNETALKELIQAAIAFNTKK